MVTLRLEIISSKGYSTGYYNPAIDDCKAYPRTEAGVKKAIAKFIAWLEVNRESMEITSARVMVYNGKHEYYNNVECVSIVPIF